jgi:formylmethanofuran dehydrogenase subunit A
VAKEKRRKVFTCFYFILCVNHVHEERNNIEMIDTFSYDTIILTWFRTKYLNDEIRWCVMLG